MSRSCYCVSSSLRVNGKRVYKTQMTGPLAVLEMLLAGLETVELCGFRLEPSEAILDILKD